MSTDAPQYRLPVNGYDAAVESAARSTIVFPYNSRLEYTHWTRRRLQEKNRALEANFAPHKRIMSQFAKHVAGRGVRPVSITRDIDWNPRADDLFNEWASNKYAYSIDASRTFWGDQRHVAAELGAGDGETFAAKVRVDGQPMIQPLDPFEVGTPWAGMMPQPYDARNALLYEDGVRIDIYFRPQSYVVCELPSIVSYVPTGAREVAAGDMIHVFHRRRTKQCRGLPPLYSGMNDEHDALDTLALAKASAKLHSLLAVSKKRVPQNKGKGLGSQIERVLKDDGSLDKLDEQFKGGAVTVELDPDEELQLHASQRPTMAEIDGIKFYIHLMSLGSELPNSVVFSFMGVGGTAVRGDLEDAQVTFEMRQDQLVWEHSQPIRTWFLADAMQRGILPPCKDPYWWKSDWHGPAKITVDYGRSAAANLALVKGGMMSIPRYCEERNMDWKSEIDKQIAWVKYARGQCTAAGIEYSDLVEATPGSAPPGSNVPEDS
jgi:capsid protein